MRELRGIVQNLLDKTIGRFGTGGDFNMNTIGAIFHPTIQSMCPGQLINEGPESHTLHNAFNMNVESFNPDIL